MGQRRAAKQFVHLHVHTDYSLLDGAAGVAEIAEFAAEDGAPAIGITDHGSMGGVLELVHQATEHGITAIPGYEAYHVPQVEQARELAKDNGKSRYHLTLLGVSGSGYRNLMQLSSVASLEHYYHKPLVDDALLAAHAEGVVATSGCLGSRFNQALLNGEEGLAKQILSDHRDIFGAERFFLEVQNHNIQDQRRVTPAHLRLAKQLGIPLLATNDSHYIKQSDAKMHDALLCMQTKSQLADEDRFRFSSDENYMRTAEEMWRLFPEEEYPGACSNTLVVAEMAADLTIDISGKNYLIPSFEVPPGEGTQEEYLRKLVDEGAQRRYGEGGRLPAPIKERIEYELGVIKEMGFVSYFLIVADVVQWAKAQGIGVGPGRGSAAGSIVSYCTSITSVDPIRYGLYFERFLNPGRKSMPDIDLDFERDRREEVVQYTIRKYGRDRVANIATYGVLKPKSALLSAARVLGYPATRGAALSALYPGVINQRAATLRQTMGEEAPEGLVDNWRAAHTLRDMYATDGETTEIVDLAMAVEGTINITGIHPAGVLITPGPLTEYVPLRRPKSEGDPSVCMYDLHGVEVIGGLKMDYLGLVNISIIKRAVELIKRDLGRTIDIENIPLDDVEVFKMLAAGDTDGIFQLESPGMRDLLIRLQPTRLEDISACIALYRPGPMGTNMHTDFADIKNGRKKISVIHKDMRELFEDTYGLMIFQEQLLALAQHYAGFNAAMADTFRKATGKKDPVLLASQEQLFKDGVVNNGYSQEIAERMWEMIPPFAAYSFNRAHSISYAMIGYQTAWLKVNYPAQYAASCIDFMPTERIPAQVEAARSRGVKVYSPDINKSHLQATTDNNSVWLGVGGVAYCGEATMAVILGERTRRGPFAGLPDLLTRVSGQGVNKKALSNLIWAGCFDALHPSRRALVENLDGLVEAAKSVGGSVVEEEDLLFGDDDLVVENALGEFKLDTPEYPTSERIALEIGALGFIAGTHPFALVEGAIPHALRQGLLPAGAVVVGDPSIKEGVKITIYGTLASIKTSETKAGKAMTRFFLETGRGPRLECILVGRPFYNARAGSFAVVSGMARVDAHSETEELTLLADDATLVELDGVSERVPEGGGSTRRSKQNRERVQERAPDGVVFRVGDKRQLKALEQELQNIPKGGVEVTISYQGEQVRLEGLGYDLDAHSLQQIAQRSGVSVLR